MSTRTSIRTTLFLGLSALLPLAPLSATTPAPPSEATPEDDPLALTDEMKAWARRAVPAAGSDLQRVQRLLEALRGLELQYRSGQTGTAADVFATKRFNCVSFSFLFVGLSRSLGLRTHFLRAEDERDFARVGELRVVARHMSAGFHEGGRRHILDFHFLREAATSRFVPLSDQRAKALYFSNLGVESLQGGAPNEAIAHFERALQLDAGLPEIWVNLGVAQRRAGDPAAAERSYRQALTLDSNDAGAYLNLASLLWDQGRPDACDHLLDLLSQTRVRDPYASLVLGDQARREGRLEDAERFYRRSISTDRRSAEARAALGLVLAETGRSRQANRRLEQALRIDPANPRALVLARVLEGG